MKRLALYRKAAGFTQAELAFRVGVRRLQICRLEAGQTNGSVSLWMRIQEVLGLSPSEIVDAMRNKEDKE